ncbi:MAG: insulinase family protein [Calditrichaeota bacterium]|nr:insulinase family protein [Calditrichota bacterium]
MKIAIITILVGLFIMSCTQTQSERLVLVASKSDPTISVRLLFHVGSQDDPVGKEGLASITAEMLTDASTLKNSYDQILQKLYPMAAGYGAQVDKEVTVITGRVHKDNWEKYYQLLKEAVLVPAFKEDDFTRIKNQTLNYLENTLRYSSDEELGKQVLNQFIFEGTAYGHPEAGLIESVKKLTVDDVKAFHKNYFTRDNLTIGLGGAITDHLAAQVKNDLETLPKSSGIRHPEINPQIIDGLQVELVEKETGSTAISFGFPIDLQRGDADFMAIWLANSWLGEHRNSSSHLYQVIREKRGLNYGDYSYIEAFPMAHVRQFPPPNVGRHHQIFQIWIRPVQNHARLFALRAAIRELQKLVDNGLSEKDFELTQKFLGKYYLHFAPATMGRLGYRLDDYFYGLKGNFLDMFPDKIKALTRDEVNAAIKKHLQYKNMKIAMVTQDAESLKKALVEDQPSPLKYSNPKPQAVLDEDKEIEAYPLKVKAENVKIVNIKDVFLH